MKKQAVLIIFVILLALTLSTPTLAIRPILPSRYLCRQCGRPFLGTEIRVRNPRIRRGVVTNVIDGDTIVVSGVGKVQLHGIDAPERGEVGYQEAKDFVRNASLNRRVRLEINRRRPRDRFGRTLATVYVGRVRRDNLNSELLLREHENCMMLCGGLRIGILRIVYV